ncbi:hypothetical protein, partial [Anaeromassilibacillus sp. An200]|uniref:hypothetical protein n=1 Tax=Anaeromassilibacillus sp. An200 TaxID=1965587 RepID=UPI003FA4B4D5
IFYRHHVKLQLHLPTPVCTYFTMVFSSGESFVNSSKVSRSCGYTPGKVTGQRATVKAEMNGLTPGLDRHPPSR